MEPPVILRGVSTYDVTSVQMYKCTEYFGTLNKFILEGSNSLRRDPLSPGWGPLAGGAPQGCIKKHNSALRLGTNRMVAAARRPAVYTLLLSIYRSRADGTAKAGRWHGKGFVQP